MTKVKDLQVHDHPYLLQKMLIEIYIGPCAYLPPCRETDAIMEKIKDAYEGKEIVTLLPYHPKVKE